VTPREHGRLGGMRSAFQSHLIKIRMLIPCAVIRIHKIWKALLIHLLNLDLDLGMAAYASHSNICLCCITPFPAMPMQYPYLLVLVP
jgi:hypothetical protein